MTTFDLKLKFECGHERQFFMLMFNPTVECGDQIICEECKEPKYISGLEFRENKRYTPEVKPEGVGGLYYIGRDAI